MAIRPLVNVTDKASTVPGVAGLALSLENASTAYPEGGNKRHLIGLQAVSVGATPVELFVDNIPAYRLRPAADSVMYVTVNAVYYSSVPANNTAYQILIGVQNIANTISFLAAPTLAAIPAVPTATLVVTVGATGLVFTGTGVAGNVNGRGEARANVTEVTDRG